MKEETFHAFSSMLKSQLREEEESYKQCVEEHKEFQDLKNIEQRIKSIVASLQLMENTDKLQTRPI
jgi:hypothetical protein